MQGLEAFSLSKYMFTHVLQRQWLSVSVRSLSGKASVERNLIDWYRMFSDFEASKGMGVPGKNYAREYFKEVLISYRVIFGQLRWSHGVYKRCRKAWISSSEADSDPLLDVLCGQH